MGGTSSTLTADTKEDLIEAAIKWYQSALRASLYPREFIYPIDTKLEIPVGKHSTIVGYLTIIDRDNIPKGVNADSPFGIYSDNLTAKEKRLRFIGFVSAHS